MPWDGDVRGRSGAVNPANAQTIQPWICAWHRPVRPLSPYLASARAFSSCSVSRLASALSMERSRRSAFAGLYNKCRVSNMPSRSFALTSFFGTRATLDSVCLTCISQHKRPACQLFDLRSAPWICHISLSLRHAFPTLGPIRRPQPICPAGWGFYLRSYFAFALRSHRATNRLELAR